MLPAKPSAAHRRRPIVLRWCSVRPPCQGRGDEREPMTNLLDIMRAPAGGHGFDLLSRQFGLSEAETQRALGAILPAFSLGLNRMLYDPARLGALVDLMVSGRYAPFFDGTSLEPGGAGTDALLRVFGSPENTQRVAEQGAQLAGIGADLMTRMMPLVAATLVGGLFRHASLEGVGDLLRQWSDAFHRAGAAGEPDRRRPVRPPVSSAMVNPFEWWSGLLVGSEARSTPPPEPPRPSDPVVSAIDAWGTMVNAMLGAPPAPTTPPKAEPPAGATNPMQVLARMFDAGREAQTQQLAAFGSILDGFARGGARRS